LFGRQWPEEDKSRQPARSVEEISEPNVERRSAPTSAQLAGPLGLPAIEQVRRPRGRIGARLATMPFEIINIVIGVAFLAILALVGNVLVRQV